MGMAKTTKEIQRRRRRRRRKGEKEQQLASWVIMRNILTCKHLEVEPQTQSQRKKQQKQKQKQKQAQAEDNINKKKKMRRCSGSLCNNVNTKVMQRPEPPSPSPRRKITSSSSSRSRSRSHEGSNRSPNANANANANGAGVLLKSASSNSGSGSGSGSANSNYSIKAMAVPLPFRRLSGCYECKMVVDPVLSFTRDPSLRATICSCPHCGQIFMKPQNLELHQAVRHAVSELGPEDTSKNIVEIIFQSSWLKKQTPVCKIDRILKVHNTLNTISKFEEYRDAIKFKATKKHPRCVADGNELLRFHSTPFKCSLGLNGSSNLCNSIPHCGVCSIIKNGFKLTDQGPTGFGKGILTTSTSGRAHDRAHVGAEEQEQEKRAMLVCRVIAGRVRNTMELEGGGSEEQEQEQEHDSVAGATGVYSNLDELYVFNPKAILPCFVVIYSL